MGRLYTDIPPRCLASFEGGPPAALTFGYRSCMMGANALRSFSTSTRRSWREGSRTRPRRSLARHIKQQRHARVVSP